MAEGVSFLNSKKRRTHPVKYTDGLRAKEQEEREARLSKLRPALRNMLKGNPNVFHYTTFATADKLFAQHPIWQQAKVEAERRLVFEEYVAELKQREMASHSNPLIVGPFSLPHSKNLVLPASALYPKLWLCSKVSKWTSSPNGGQPRQRSWIHRSGTTMKSCGSYLCLTFSSLLKTTVVFANENSKNKCAAPRSRRRVRNAKLGKVSR